jgi:3-phenylpropionate/trans-cinnamate dioxygenase ferredoxin subunit
MTADRPTPSTSAHTWQAVLGSAAELPAEGDSAVFTNDERTIAIFNVDGEFFAIDDTCTHRPASLSEDGAVDDGLLICGWHGSTFDLATGENVGPPACDGLRTYELEIRDQIVARERA